MDGGPEDREVGEPSLSEAAETLGVPPALLREWEERYGLIVPERDEEGTPRYTSGQLLQLGWLVEQVAAGGTADDAHRELRESGVLRVGAQVLEPVGPPVESLAHRFQRWATEEPVASRVLDRVRARFDLPSAFLVVNFVHPEAGPAGTIVVLRLAPGARPRPARRRLVSTIPFRELGDYPDRWARGETVLVRVAEMPPALRVRYAGVPVAWSLNIPLSFQGRWLGLIGATTRREPPSSEAVAVMRVAGDLLLAEFGVAEARAAFAAGVAREPRTLQDQS